MIGTIIGAAGLIALFVGALVGEGRAWVAPFRVSLSLVAVITLHAFIAALMLPFDFVRGGGSLLPVVFMVFGSFALARVLAGASDHAVDGGVRRVFILLLIVALFAAVGLEPPSSAASPKPMFPYTEPSLFALAFMPLLMYRCVVSVGAARWLWLLIGFAIALLMENLTLVVGCMLIASVCLRSFALAVLLALGVAMVATLDVSYYSSRLDLSDDTRNISTLVYLQGWQLIWESLGRSAWWGIGLQQLGLAGSAGSANTALTELVGDNSNIFDGGFVLSKLVSEFGIFGLALVAVYLRTAWRSIRLLRQVAHERSYPAAAIILARAAVAIYGVEMFLRGAGFFTPSAMMVAAALWVIKFSSEGRRAAGDPALPGTTEEGSQPANAALPH
jgi:hypothetical protein